MRMFYGGHSCKDARKQQQSYTYCHRALLLKPLCFLRKANGFLSQLPLWRCSATENASERRHVSRVPVGWHFGDNRAKRGGRELRVAPICAVVIVTRARANEKMSPQRAHTAKGQWQNYWWHLGSGHFAVAAAAAESFGDAICLGSIGSNGPATQKNERSLSLMSHHYWEKSLILAEKKRRML